MKQFKPRITAIDNTILRGHVLERGTFFRSTYKRQNAVRLTWEFKEATTDEIVRLAYAYGKNGDSWVRAVRNGDL